MSIGNPFLLRHVQVFFCWINLKLVPLFERLVYDLSYFGILY